MKRRIVFFAAVFFALSTVGTAGAQESERLGEVKLTLTSLWTFATLNYLYCDVAGLMDADMLGQYLAGSVGGVEMDEYFLLGATILMEVPMAMVVLTNVLDPGAARIANIGAGVLMTAVQAATLFMGEPTPYYAFSSAVEIATTSFIAYYAYRNLKQPKALPLVSVGKDSLTIGARLAL